VKDKTHDMNRGYSADIAEAGCEIIPNSEVTTRSQYRKRKDGEAGMKGPTAPRNSSLEIDSVYEDDDKSGIGGFLPRNNYKDRF
jgi:hypothetical protein